MNPQRLPRRVLRLLLSSRQKDEAIDFMDLCWACAARPYAVLRALRSLAAAGLVDPIRLRLTFQGLAVASALCAAPRGGGARGAPARTQPPGAGPGSARCAA